MVLRSIFFFPIQNLGIEHCGNLIKELWLFLENHRMVRVGRDIWRFSHPPSCSHRAILSQLSRSVSRWIWHISEDGDNKHSRQPVLVLPHHEQGVSWCSGSTCFCVCPILQHHCTGPSERLPRTLSFWRWFGRFLCDGALQAFPCSCAGDPA